MTREPDWVSAHAFYQDHLDPLITEVVHPLTVELTRDRLANKSFFLRYWDGGPHLRLRVLPTSRAHRSAVERLIVIRFNEFYGAHPSADRMNSREYLTMARTLARREGTSYDPALQPNNTVTFAEYRPEVHKYGSGESMRAVERHFVESSEIAMGILREKPTPDRLVQSAYAMLLLAWFVAEPDPAALQKWITARGAGHAAADLHQTPAGVADATRRIQLLARRWGEAGSGSLASWARSVAALREVLQPDRVLTVIDICAHLICNRLGIPMDNEAALRRLAMKAISTVWERV